MARRGRPPSLSARGALRTAGALAVVAAGAACLAGLICAARLVVDLAAVVFLAALVFRLMVSAAGVSEAGTDEDAAEAIDDARLPSYSVLVPLRHEAAMVPGLVAALGALDYPASKLEVLFLVEADDGATRLALLAARLPAHMRVLVVPDGRPRTKPRALNAGLLVARGALVTVYDAEDRPAPDQLRLAAARFAQAPPDLACLQARLAISNRDGLLPRLFAIEYAGLFDLYNVGATRLGLPVALGGTSNHVRAAALRRVGGWDAFNVTEDADLGLRLARFGYRVGDLPSTTWERAETSARAWFNQRRRWTKGWMQTALVLARDGRALRDLGWARAAAVALMLVNLVAGPLLSPVALGLLVLHLARSGLPRPDGFVETAEATLAATVLVLGAVAPLWCGHAGLRARGLRGLAAYLPLSLPYLLMISAAAWGGLLDLVLRPHHWRKTPHTAAAASLVHRPKRRRGGEGRPGESGEAQGAQHQERRREGHGVVEAGGRRRHAEDQHGRAERQDQHGKQQPALA